MKIILIIFAFFPLASLNLHGESIRSMDTPPNIVLLFIDDLGYGDVGVYGAPDIPTPHIDSLAETGVLFTNGHSTASVCHPSRTGMLSGLYQQRFGVNGNSERGTPHPAGHPTIAQSLQKAGYVTGMVGRWDTGDRSQGALDMGFDEVARRPRPPADGPSPTYMGEDGEYWTEIQGPEMADFVRRHKDEKFFLYYAPLAVHSPVDEAPQKFKDRVPANTPKKRIGLAASLIAADDAIGVLLSELEQQGLRENTLIIFSSDNGGRRPDAARNDPWRGAKGGYWNGGTAVPYILSWPARLPKSEVFNAPVSTLDFYPTALAAAEGAVPPNLDGVNLLPHITGERTGDPHEFLFFRMIESDNLFKYRKEMRAVLSWPWRLIGQRPPLDFSNYSVELYNLADDPREQNDVYDEYPEVAARLEKALADWEKDLPPADTEADGNASLQGPMPSGRGWATSQ